MRGLSFEQLVALADATCSHTGARIISYPTLAAAAALTTARLHGVPLYATAEAAAAGLVSQLRARPALDSANEAFALAAADVLLRLNDPLESLVDPSRPVM